MSKNNMLAVTRRILAAVEVIGKSLKNDAKRTGEPQQATEEKQTEARDIRATINLPQGVETRQNKEDATRESTYRSRTLIVSVAGLILILAYTTVAAFQWCAINQSNKISHYAMVVSQRAFVFSPGAFDETPGQDASTKVKLGIFTFHMENSGNTPATITGNFINTNYYRTPNYNWDKLPEGFTFPDNPASAAFPNSTITGGRFVLAPHDSENFQVVGIPESVFPLVNVGKAHVYFWGWVAYTDVFGCTHKTEFARELTSAQPIGPKGRLQFYIDNLSKHNCIDGDCTDYEKSKDQSCNEPTPN